VVRLVMKMESERFLHFLISTFGGVLSRCIGGSGPPTDAPTLTSADPSPTVELFAVVGNDCLRVPKADKDVVL
jgi:hypothetical protein